MLEEYLEIVLLFKDTKLDTSIIKDPGNSDEND